MTLKRLMALLLAALMVFSLLTVLTACDGEDDDRRSSSRRDKDDDDDDDDDKKDRDDNEDNGPRVKEIDPEDLEWEVTDNGIKLTNYTGDDVHVKIPDTIDGKKVVSLGTAFAGNVTVQTIVLGAYFESLNGSWLEECDALVRLEGPNVTDLVGEELDCESLEELILPSLDWLNLSKIDNCETLRYLEIPNVEMIVCYNGSTWNMCLWPENLEEVVMPENMMARMDAFCEWPGVDVPYVMICSMAVESCLDEDNGVDFDDPRYAAGYVTMNEDELNMFYCNFFQHDTIIVNGERYELD